VGGPSTEARGPPAPPSGSSETHFTPTVTAQAGRAHYPWRAAAARRRQCSFLPPGPQGTLLHFLPNLGAVLEHYSADCSPKTAPSPHQPGPNTPRTVPCGSMKAPSRVSLPYPYRLPALVVDGTATWSRPSASCTCRWGHYHSSVWHIFLSQLQHNALELCELFLYIAYLQCLWRVRRTHGQGCVCP
jgi:hypothetical protein